MKFTLNTLLLTTVISVSSTAALAAAPCFEAEPGQMPLPGSGMPGPHGPVGAMLPLSPMGMPGPGGAVIDDLEQLQLLYSLTGSDAQLLSIYRDVLNKSKDPVVRQYTYAAIARAQMHPSNPADAIVTIRHSLDEDLARAAKMTPPE